MLRLIISFMIIIILTFLLYLIQAIYKVVKYLLMNSFAFQMITLIFKHSFLVMLSRIKLFMPPLSMHLFYFLPFLFIIKGMNYSRDYPLIQQVQVSQNHIPFFLQQVLMQHFHVHHCDHHVNVVELYQINVPFVMLLIQVFLLQVMVFKLLDLRFLLNQLIFQLHLAIFLLHLLPSLPIVSLLHKFIA